MSNRAGEVLGTLSISADDLEREIDVKCSVVDGLPMYDADDVSSDEFTVRWVNVGDNPVYTLDVRQGTASLAGYPLSVSAARTSDRVHLQPLVAYTEVRDQARDHRRPRALDRSDV